MLYISALSSNNKIKIFLIFVKNSIFRLIFLNFIDIIKKRKEVISMNIGDKIYFITLLIIFFLNFSKFIYLFNRDVEATFLRLVFLVLEILGTNIIYVFIHYYFYKMNFANSVISSLVFLIVIFLVALSGYYDIRKDEKLYQETERKK